VLRYFYACRDVSLFDAIKKALVMSLSEIERREASPSAAIIDSQSVKSTESGGVGGYDAGKKIKGRTRHIPTDTRGSWFSFSCMQPIFRTGTGPSMCSWRSADASRGCAMPSPVVAMSGRNCATRSPAMAAGLSRSSGDLMQQKLRDYARRWVVERTFAWLGRCRGLAKDWERPSPHQPLGRWPCPFACSPEEPQDPAMLKKVVNRALGSAQRPKSRHFGVAYRVASNAGEEVCPRTPGVVVCEAEGQRIMQFMTWGFPLRPKALV